MNTQILRFFALCVLLFAAGSCSKDDNVTIDKPVAAGEERIKEILLELYDATDGPNWVKQPTNWKMETPLAKWKFVSYSDSVVTLSFNGLGLTGEFPKSFNEITCFSQLYLANNHLTGPIPENIGNSPRLNLLDLTNNDITGTIPESISKVTMSTLRLSGNRMSGKIPDAVRKMPYYSFFALDQQEGYGFSNAAMDDSNTDRAALMAFKESLIAAGATDPLPTWIAENPLSKFEGLYLDGFGRVSVMNLDLSKFGIRNHPELPDELGDLSELYALYLSFTNLTTLPNGLARLKKLRVLAVTNSPLESIPEVIFSLKNLEKLFLYDSRLTGSIPEEIGSLTDLTHLDLSGNSFTGLIPDSFASLTKMDYFKLSGCVGLEKQPIPNWIGQWTRIATLNLSSCKWSGDLPESLANCKRLYSFTISYNYITGELPEFLGDMPYLSSFDCKNNNFEGAIPQKILDHKYVKYWYFSPQREGFGFTNVPSKTALTGDAAVAVAADPTLGF